MTENNEVWIESDMYINADQKLEHLMGVEKYKQFCKDYDKKRKEEKFLINEPFLKIDSILKNRPQHFEVGDCSGFSYFGVWVYLNKSKYDIILNIESYKYNPYKSVKYEKLTKEAAQQLINSEAERMNKIGTYYPPYSVLIEELNKY